VLHLKLDRDGRVYFTLTCNGCTAPFVCYDNACYTFASLRLAAVFAGWDAAPRPEQPSFCTSCIRTRDTSRTPGDVAASQNS
jgi:hypothetical protein